MLVIQVEGNQGDDSLGIAYELVSKLKTRLSVERVKEDTGAELVGTSQLTSAKSLMVNDFSEKTNFTIDLSVIDCIIDENPHFIDSITTESELVQQDSSIDEVVVDVSNSL